MKLASILVLGCLFHATAVVAGPYEDARERWLVEAQRLDAANERYAATVDAQAASIRRLEEARAAVDAAISDPNVKVDELRRLEDALSDARDEAINLAEDAASTRRRIYEQIELVEELGAQVEGMRGGKLVEDAGVGGTWRAEWDESGDFGLVRLQANGNLITGSFRLTNGNAGSLKGTFGGGEVRLDIVSTAKGMVGSLVATVEAGGDRIEGTWSRLDVGGGQRAAGRIELTRLDEDEAADILSGLR